MMKLILLWSSGIWHIILMQLFDPTTRVRRSSVQGDRTIIHDYNNNVKSPFWINEHDLCVNDATNVCRRRPVLPSRVQRKQRVFVAWTTKRKTKTHLRNKNNGKDIILIRKIIEIASFSQWVFEIYFYRPSLKHVSV